MRKAQEIRNKIDDDRTLIDKIITAAESDNRDLSAHEKSEVDKVLARIEDLHSQLETATKIENERKLRVREALGPQLQKTLFENGHGGGGQPKWSHDRNGNKFCALSKDQSAKALFGHSESGDYDFGHYVLAKQFGCTSSTPDFVKYQIRNDLSEGVNPNGGYLVPSELMPGFVDLARAQPVLIAAGAATVMMGSETLTIPQLATDATVNTVAENTTIPATNMTFSACQLTAYKLASRVEVSRELFEDATELAAQQLTVAMARNMASQIDYFGLRGNGSAQPLGLLNKEGLEETGSVGAITWEDVAGAVLEVRKNNHTPTGVILSPTIHHDLMLLLTGDGSTSEKNWLMAPPTVTDKTMWTSTHMPDTDLIVGDFRNFVIGMRNQVAIEGTTSGGDAFADHQVWLKCFARVAFGQYDLSAFHALRGITT